MNGVTSDIRDMTRGLDDPVYYIYKRLPQFINQYEFIARLAERNAPSLEESRILERLFTSLELQFGQ